MKFSLQQGEKVSGWCILFLDHVKIKKKKIFFLHPLSLLLSLHRTTTQQLLSKQASPNTH